MISMRGALAAVVLCVVGLAVAAGPGDEKRFAVLDKLESSKTPVVIKFPKGSLAEVLESLSQIGGFQVEWKGQKPTGSVSVDWTSITVKEALIRLGKEQYLDYEVPAATKLVVTSSPRGANPTK
ncbi:MAG: hypothetical protein U0V87_04705 [Acidobacteriota bacterium]